ncbi:MAG: hypothetical protein MK135_08610 [Polyangiaceae bacterium]|nr:hypothetical protein [Polyangiaceae bacterium]
MRFIAGAVFFGLAFWLASLIETSLRISLIWGSLLYISLYLRDAFDVITLGKLRLPDYPSLADASGVLFEVLIILFYLGALLSFPLIPATMLVKWVGKFLAASLFTLVLVRCEAVRQQLDEIEVEKEAPPSIQPLGFFLFCLAHLFVGQAVFSYLSQSLPVFTPGILMAWTLFARVFLFCARSPIFRADAD